VHTRRHSVVGIERVPARKRCAWPKELAELLGKIPDARLARRAGVDSGTVAAERQRREIDPCCPHQSPVEWTEEMIAQLGSASDREVALTLGISYYAVGRKRRLLKIPSFYPPPSRLSNPAFPWRPQDVTMLGMMTDRELATRLGISSSTVAKKRHLLGIPPFCPAGRRVRWNEEMLELLGKVRDSEVARHYGIPKKSVYQKRSRLGIPAFLETRTVICNPGIVEVLELPTIEAQRRTGLGEGMLRRLRNELGVAAPSLVQWRWDAELLTRLGREPDAAIARDLGVHVSCIEHKRRALGIERFPSRRRGLPQESGSTPTGSAGERSSSLIRTPARRRYLWPEALAKLLGEIPDAELAVKAGVSVSTVTTERQRRGIEAFKLHRRPIEWTSEMISRLGSTGDSEVARDLGISKGSVRRKRQGLGIQPFDLIPCRVHQGVAWTAEQLALLGRLPDKAVAARIGVTVTTVARKRQELGISPLWQPARSIEWSDEMVLSLGRATDAEVARRYGISAYTVFKKRSRLGIPAFIETRAIVRTAELAELLTLPNREVRLRTGLGRDTVRRLREELGIEIAKRSSG
jgi:DNA-binding CsgD family transcriptional regulator